jgi:hypothetical protein
MKLNVTQANILAQEVVNEIKKSKKPNKELEKKVKVFLDKYEKDSKVISDLESKKAKLVQERTQFILNFYRSYNLNNSYIPVAKVENIVHQIESKLIPTKEEIYNKIVMKSLFATEQDMQNFIKEIVEQYSK